MAGIQWLVVRDKEKEQEEERGFVTEDGAARIDTKASAEGAQPVMGARISLHLCFSSLKGKWDIQMVQRDWAAEEREESCECEGRQ